jgi:glycosyltransferase involved in cell wall biosynthesis
MPSDTRITILLCTLNGAAHLEEQLNSYLAQDHPHWDLWVSDDGSTDGTLDVLEEFRRRHGASHDIRVLPGPRRGTAANFLTLLCHPDLPANRPVALSDQDDVWLPGKLTRALAALDRSGPVTLYSGQSFHTDAALRQIGLSRPPRRTPSFRNALTQNVVSGHSLVMDAGALALVRQAGVPDAVPYHDWWLYQLISGAGGQVRVDTARMIHYRQHGDNAMGAHEGWQATLERVGQVLGRTYGDWIARNTAALDRVADLLTPENRALLAAMRAVPPGPARARLLWRLGLYRQTRAATAAFYLAALLGRV